MVVGSSRVEGRRKGEVWEGEGGVLWGPAGRRSDVRDRQGGCYLANQAARDGA